jgi:hypothetical protein
MNLNALALLLLLWKVLLCSAKNGREQVIYDVKNKLA